MKNRRLLTILLAISMTASMLLAACGSKAEPTLESVIKDDPEFQTEIEKMTDENLQQGLSVDIKGNDIIYNFDLSAVDGFTDETAKDETIKAALEAGMEEHAEEFKKVAADMSANTKVEGIRVVVNYNYGDEVIATATFEPDKE